MKITLLKNDLPSEFLNGMDSVAIDTETMGLCPHRDRLCLAQFFTGNDECYLVQFDKYPNSENIKKILVNKKILKIFHYARFDIMMFYKHLNVMTENIYCTKIASKLARTYAAKHSLLELCRDLLHIEILKDQTCTDWGCEQLTNQQKEYAATDVLYLHKIKEKLDLMLKREHREDLAINCFNFLATRIRMDLMASESYDIFAH